MTMPVTPVNRPCLWCQGELHYALGRGWLHEDGKLYKTVIGADGIERDDHAALPGAPFDPEERP